MYGNRSVSHKTRVPGSLPPGLVLTGHKRRSQSAGIVPAGLPQHLVLPLTQHAGQPAEPLLRPGDKVLKGQPIARSSVHISASVHAPSSGKVLTIEERPVPHPSGLLAPCMIIAPDGAEQWVEREIPGRWQELPPAEVLEHIRDAGITGLGGASFPTAVKLDPGAQRTIHTLILNGVECEPYITADDVLMRERADEIIAGTQIIAHLLEPREVLLAVEDNKPEAIAALQAAAQGSGFKVMPTPTHYPSGGERQLVQMLLGREVPSGQLPADVGVVCQNVATAASIHRALEKGEPLIHRVTTVTGGAVRRPQNYEALLGTPASHLLQQSGLQEEQLSQLIMGGPMMGFALPSLETPVVKSTNCLLAATVREVPPPPPAQPCIRCGMCDEVCPAKLLPQQLYWYAQAGDHEQLEEHHLFDCIECGACAWVCPSHIPLVQYYRSAKGEINRQNTERAQAEIAKQRFEFREQRLARERREQEAARRARRAQAQSKAEADAIQEALERVRTREDEPETDE